METEGRSGKRGRHHVEYSEAATGGGRDGPSLPGRYCCVVRAGESFPSVTESKRDASPACRLKLVWLRPPVRSVPCGSILSRRRTRDVRRSLYARRVVDAGLGRAAGRFPQCLCCPAPHGSTVDVVPFRLTRADGGTGAKCKLATGKLRLK